MPSKSQVTGMRGVYLVASELSKFGLIASPTSRSAEGADVLVTDQSCKKAFTVQVKTNTKTFTFWLMGKNSKEIVSGSHICIFLNIRSKGEEEVFDYYVVPSIIVAKYLKYSKSPKSEWYSIFLKDIESYKNKWEIFKEQ